MVNVILYTIDCFRVDALSDKFTPNIMNLVKGGTRFTNAFTCSGYTGYSCASILTGLYTHNHGYTKIFGSIREGVKHLPEVLSTAGLRTFGFVGVDKIIDKEQGFDRGFDEFKYSASWVDDALRVITDNDNFFIWGHYFDIHNVFDLSSYDLKVSVMDENLIGRTIECLGDRIDDTIIIITADHGEGLNAHGYAGHDSPYDEVVRIPLVFYGRGIGKGVTNREIVRSVDIMPTIMKLLGIKIDKRMDGRPMLPETPDNNDSYFYNIFADGSKGYRCIRQDNWKLIEFFFRDSESRYELYDIPSDIQELNDVSLKHPDVVMALKNRINALTGVGGVSQLSDDDRSIVVEKLKSLGYL